MEGIDLLFLVVGVVVVVAVGRLLAYSGRRFVSSVPEGGRGLGSAAVLVSVVFHLVTLGIVALISVLPMGGTTAQSFMVRLGILLLILGAAYGVSINALARRRAAAVTEAAVAERSHADEAGTRPPSAVERMPMPQDDPTAAARVEEEPASQRESETDQGY